MHDLLAGVLFLILFGGFFIYQLKQDVADKSKPIEEKAVVTHKSANPYPYNASIQNYSLIAEVAGKPYNLTISYEQFKAITEGQEIRIAGFLNRKGDTKIYQTVLT